MKSKEIISNPELFKAIFQTCAEGLILVDTSGTIQLCNPRAEEIFGYDGEELIGSNINLLLPKDFRKNHSQKMKDFHRNPSKRAMGLGLELFGLRKDGSEFPTSISLSYTKLGDEQYALAFITDISLRKKIEASARDEQIRYQSVIDTAIDGIVTISEHGLIESINPAVEKLFGYSKEELIDQNIKILMPEPYHSQHDGYIEKYNQTGQRHIIGIGREVTGKRKNGTTFPFKLSVSELIIDEKKVFTGIIHDLSEEKEAQEKLRKLNADLEKRVEARTKELASLVTKLEDRNKQLKEAEEEVRNALRKEKELNELKSRFVSMASHEFRTPLSTILSSTSLIQKYNLPEHKEKKEKHISRIQSNVRNLTSILNEFLSLDKLEAGLINCQPQEFNLRELAASIVDEMDGIIKKGQKINHKHSGEAQVFLDPHLVKNIVINLLSNAIKYSNEGQDIEFNSSKKNDLITLEVTDQGIGIPEEDQSHLFERFFRAKNVTNIQGTGLGLNIVKKYAELMDGSLDFRSEYEVGSTFTVKLKETQL